ncbi:hypothetical protein C5167_029550 [Papaver somniferum]|nr:hypothetical protein C5167_029550 [Papaver somniferum]
MANRLLIDLNGASTSSLTLKSMVVEDTEQDTISLQEWRSLKISSGNQKGTGK